ncbi:hypothetical protein EON67_11465 [archaeon]|nr:MAG: hypothetical protein EON67_11465 [archaeon]
MRTRVRVAVTAAAATLRHRVHAAAHAASIPLLQGGRIAVMPVDDKYILVACAELRAEVGMIKLKVRCSLTRVLHARAAAPPAPLACARPALHARLPARAGPHLSFMQLEAAKRALAEPLARITATPDITS